MADHQETIAQLQAELVDRKGRLSKLEEELGDVKARPKTGWDKVEILLPTAQAVFLALVAYFLTDSVNRTLQKKQLQLSHVTEMRQELAQLGKAGTPREEVEAAAYALAAFGGPAIAPLINVLDAGGELRVPAAENALRAIGLSEPGVVCPSLIRIVRNRTGAFTWETHRSAIRLLGDLNCRKAVPALRAYADSLEGISTPAALRNYHSRVRQDPTPTLESVTLLQNDLVRALAVLSDRVGK